MTESALLIVVEREIKGLSSNFNADNYADAVDEAERETGFSLPTTNAFQILWLKRRTVRALLFSLMTEHTESFKVKQMNLNQMFDQLNKMIVQMDKEFEKALEENAYEFANVRATQAFGHKIDAGFAYGKWTGIDRTYDDDQLVMVNPSSDD